MKNLGKIIIYIFLGLFAIILIAGALGPKEVKIKRSIVIDQPVPDVFEYATDYNHMLKWNPRMKKDSIVNQTITGEPGKEGSRWTWEGESVGKGYIEIKEIIPNKKVVSEMRFIEPWESKTTEIREFEKTNEGTQVTWISKSELSFPIERIVGFFMDDMMGSDLSQGLKNLKKYANRQANLVPVIKTIEIEGMTCNGCEKTINKALKKLPGVMEVEASHKKGIATVKVDSSTFAPNEYKKAIEKVGYKMLNIK